MTKRGGLTRIGPASAIIRALGRLIGPVKLGPYMGTSSDGVLICTPLFEPVMFSYSCRYCLASYRERGAPIACLWSRMQRLFHEVFSFESAVVDSLSVFNIEAVSSFSCVHPY